MKIIIAGGRDFEQFGFLCEKCDHLTSGQDVVEVVSGTAAGADTLGAKWSRKMGHGLKEFPAEWNVYGRSAGFRRNEQMAKYADALIAFWDGKSRGTAHMITLAKKVGLKTRVVLYI